MNNKTFLAKCVKKNSIKRIGIAIIFFAISSILIYSNRIFIITVLNGRLEIIGAREAEEAYEDNRLYISMFVYDLYSTDYVVETTKKTNGIKTSQKNTSFFMIAELESGLIIVEFPYKYYDDEDFQTENIKLMGKLKVPTKNYNIVNAIAQELAVDFDISKQEVFDEYLSYVYVDATDPNALSDKALIFVIIVVCFIGIMILIFSILELINPRRHRVYKSLQKYGDREYIESEIQKEFDNQTLHLITKAGNDYIFKNYTVINSDGIKVFPTKDLLWIYQYNYKYKGSTTYYIKLFFKDITQDIKIKAKNYAEAVKSLADIDSKLHVICGYDKEIEILYQKDKAGFMDFYNKYQERKSSSQ